MRKLESMFKDWHKGQNQAAKVGVRVRLSLVVLSDASWESSVDGHFGYM